MGLADSQIPHSNPQALTALIKHSFSLRPAGSHLPFIHPKFPLHPTDAPAALQDHPQDSGVFSLLLQTRGKAAEGHLRMETEDCESSGHASKNKAFSSSLLSLPFPPRHDGALGSPAFPPLMLKETVVQWEQEEQKGPSLCVRE